MTLNGSWMVLPRFGLVFRTVAPLGDMHACNGQRVKKHAEQQCCSVTSPRSRHATASRTLKKHGEQQCCSVTSPPAACCPSSISQFHTGQSNDEYTNIPSEMLDDLANNWGVELCIPDRYSRSSHQAPSLSSSTSELSQLVAQVTDKFIFDRVTICGSQANSWAIDDATNQNASLCLFAAGSYVAGDGSALQTFSTSEFDVGKLVALTMPPEEVHIPACRVNTVPLPYHIPGVVEPEELMAYEDECLQAVHIRLCWAKMRSMPYKALFMELVLAGNGATLSNRALVAIGKLAVHHEICVVVDEIMTGGRTGSMLYLLSKPLTFQAAVTHITMGKWCKLGMVLLSKKWAAKREVMYPVTKRGASTFIPAVEAAVHWRCLNQRLSEIPERRARVLAKLQLKEEQVWGVGLLLFGPCQLETAYGLKCRYLPLVHANTPIDTVKSTLVKPGYAQTFRFHVNQLVMDATRKWILDVPQPKVDAHSTAAEQKMDAERLSDYSFIAKLVKGCSELEEKPSDEWRAKCMPKDINRTQGEAALRRLSEAGCMEQTQTGNKRKRQWKLQEGCIAPWKCDDYDEIIAGMHN